MQKRRKTRKNVRKLEENAFLDQICEARQGGEGHGTRHINGIVVVVGAALVALFASYTE